MKKNIISSSLNPITSIYSTYYFSIFSFVSFLFRVGSHYIYSSHLSYQDLLLMKLTSCESVLFQLTFFGHTGFLFQILWHITVFSTLKRNVVTGPAAILHILPLLPGRVQNLSLEGSRITLNLVTGPVSMTVWALTMFLSPDLA